MDSDFEAVYQPLHSTSEQEEEADDSDPGRHHNIRILPDKDKGFGLWNLFSQFIKMPCWKSLRMVIVSLTLDWDTYTTFKFFH